jgi:hypothetical protein
MYRQIILLSYCSCFVKQIFSAEFHAVPSVEIGSSAELGMPRNETVPSLFRGIFSERNSVPHPILDPALGLDLPFLPPYAIQ